MTTTKPVKQPTCPMCYGPAVRKCRNCGTEIQRNQRGGIDIALQPHPDYPDVLRRVYQGESNSRLTIRSAPRFHDPAARRSGIPPVEDMLPPSTADKRLGTFYFGKGAA